MLHAHSMIASCQNGIFTPANLFSPVKRQKQKYLSVRAAFSGGGRDKRASTQTDPGGGGY